MVAVAVVDVGCCGMMWYDVVWCGVTTHLRITMLTD